METVCKYTIQKTKREFTGNAAGLTKASLERMRMFLPVLLSNAPSTTTLVKKRTILVMHHVISKNLQSDFAAIHRCVKSRQWQLPLPQLHAPASIEASHVRSRFRSRMKHLDSSISQDSDCMHQLHCSFLFFVQGSSTIR